MKFRVSLVCMPVTVREQKSKRSNRGKKELSRSEQEQAERSMSQKEQRSQRKCLATNATAERRA